MQRIRRYACALLVAVLVATGAAAGGVAAWIERGPVLGSLTPTGITVWLQAAAPLTVRVAARAGSGAEVVSPPARLTADHRLMAKLHLDGLKPDTVYRYRILAEGLEPWADDGFTFRTPPPDGHPCRLTIAAGSGASDWRETRPRIWKAIAEAHPDLFIALGDTPYADGLLERAQRTWLAARRRAPSAATGALLDGATAAFRRRATWAMPLAYEYIRSSDGFAAMSRHTAWVATWDDHETGINDSDRTNPVLDIARHTFEAYTPNPSFGLPGAGGVFWIQRYGDVEIYLLDDESFRTPTAEARRDPEHATILGAAQLHWLIDHLTRSQATFKILACGSPFNDSPRKSDAWATYPRERARLVAAIAEHHVGGVVLLSGDIHRMEVYRLPWLEKRGGYPLTEVVSSPLYNIARRCGPNPEHRLFCIGGDHLHIGQYYAAIAIDTTLADPTLTIEVRNADNEVLYHATLRRSALEFRDDAP